MKWFEEDSKEDEMRMLFYEIEQTSLLFVCYIVSIFL